MLYILKLKEQLLKIQKLHNKLVINVIYTHTRAHTEKEWKWKWKAHAERETEVKMQAGLTK